jgi:hypothetical protein
MGTTMNRIVKYFGIAGGTIPILLLLITYIELAIDVKRIPHATTYGLYVWPSSVMLVDGAETLTLGTIVRLVVSLLVNILLYTVVGLFISGILKSGRYLNQKWNQ